MQKVSHFACMKSPRSTLIGTWVRQYGTDRNRSRSHPTYLCSPKIDVQSKLARSFYRFDKHGLTYFLVT